jgi:multicomponent Na+:H+ antiporter subunit C
METLGLFNFWVFAVIFCIGLYTIISRPNLVKKIIGLGILQTGVFLLFLSLAFVHGGSVPILESAHGHALPGPPSTTHVNPLPHVLILTAIVVSVSTMALALALAIRIKAEWGSVEDDELREMETR